jgi:hypothetical protein
MHRIIGACMVSVVACILILCFTTMAMADTGAKGSLGIYIYENIEGYHTVSSTAGTELANVFTPVFGKVMAYDNIPLESNETVRILEEMTKDRKVTVTVLNTWLSGGSLSVPTVTFADDDIKFKDLTWHVDQKAVLADAKEKGMTYALFGSISGLVKGVEGEGAKQRLVSVNTIANLKLVDISQGTVVWAKTYREIKAGFDARTAFDDAVVSLSAKAGNEILEFLK